MQCCFTSTETFRTVRDRESRTAFSPFTQLLSSDSETERGPGLCTLHLFTQMPGEKVTVCDSGLCCCACVASFKRWLTPLYVASDRRQDVCMSSVVSVKRIRVHKLSSALCRMNNTILRYICWHSSPSVCTHHIWVFSPCWFWIPNIDHATTKKHFRIRLCLNST